MPSSWVKLLERRWMLMVGVAIALLVIAAVLHQRHRYKHFAVHEPNRVYRSAWLESDVYAELIRKYKIKTVVNLCYPGEMGDRNLSERRAVEGAGAKLIELPFPPNDTWNVDYDSVERMEQILDDPATYPVWIHCQHGRERTVKALAIYDIRERHLSARQSLESMPLFDDPHPWPIVTFAYNYESKMRDVRKHESLARHPEQPAMPSPARSVPSRR
ncbi:MAG: hypothetical protein K1X74_12110 [Pirellulales bacterium]|nr:hypothetical protein [Pirellulales bacterium]